MKYLLLVTLALCPVAPVIAAEPTTGTIEEVIVTATRRSENLRDVSGSVSALTTEDIRRQGFDDLQGFARTIPGVSLHQIIKNRSVFTIRGINTDIGETQLTQEPVSVYINDMPVTQPYAALVQPDLRLYDIDRVEVLRGPQGTLFGSGSLGGTVRVITNKPDLESFGASVRIDAADTRDAGGRFRYDGMLNIPLIHNELAIRAVAYVRNESGWVENINLGNDNSSDDSGGRISLLWQPSDNFEASLEHLIQNSNPEGGDSWNPALGQFKRSTLVNEARKADLEQSGLTLKWTLPTVELYSSTNLQRTESNWNVQLGTIPGFASGVVTNESPFYDTDFFSQEVRATWEASDTINIVAGLFYLKSENDSTFDFGIPGLADFVNGIIGVPGFIQRDSIGASPVEFVAEEKAIFADLSWDLTDTLSLGAGLRYSQTDSDYFTGEGYGFDFATFSPFVAPVVRNINEETGTMWRLVGAWKPDASRHFYINLSKGFRVGQVNPNNGPSNVDPTDYVIPPDYQKDESFNIELGAKQRLWDDRMQFNAAVYRIDWTDIQVDATRPSDRLNYIANAGDAISRGIELELETWVTDQFKVDASLTFQDAEIDAVDPVQSFNSGALVGDRLPGAADFLASLSTEYYWSWRSISFIGLASLQRVGDSVNRLSLQTGTGQPNPDRETNEAYTNVNASVSAVLENWEATLYVENLTDSDDIILNVGLQGGNPFTTLRPRTVGARFEYFF